MKDTSRVFLFVFLLFLTCAFSFADEAPGSSLSFLVPESLSLDGSFGVGYALGEGAEAAKAALLETGAAAAGIIAAELWRADLSARWPVTPAFGLALDLGAGPAAFAAAGYDGAGTPVEGRLYAPFAVDIAALAAFRWELASGALYTAVGPLLGLPFFGGLITLKSGGLTTRASVPADQLRKASFGGMIKTGYSFSVGPGTIDAGLRVIYRYFSAEGLLLGEDLFIHGITPLVFLGYTLKVR